MTASVERGRVLVLPSFLRDYQRATERVEVLGLLGVSAETVEVPAEFRWNMFAELDAIERNPELLPVIQQYNNSVREALERVDLVVVDNKRSETNQTCRWEHAVGPRAMKVVSYAGQWITENVALQPENQNTDERRKKLVEDAARLFPPRLRRRRVKPLVLLYTPRFDDYGCPKDCMASDVYLRHQELEQLKVPSLDGNLGGVREELRRIRKARSGRSRNGKVEATGQPPTEAAVPNGKATIPEPEVEVTVSM